MKSIYPTRLSVRLLLLCALFSGGTLTAQAAEKATPDKAATDKAAMDKAAAGKPAADKGATAKPLTAAEEAKLGKEAAAKNDVVKAQGHYVKAHLLEPANPDYAHSAAVLSAAQGLSEQALTYFKAAAKLAALAHKHEDIAFYNEEISKLVGGVPAWVDEKIAAAAPVPPGKEKVVGNWSQLKAEVSNLQMQGQNEQAVTVAQKALSTAQEGLGANHYATFASRRDLAGTLIQVGKVAEAEKLLLQVIGDGQRILGANHPDILIAQTMLADIYEGQAKYKEAIAQLKTAHAAATAGLGGNHPTTFSVAMALIRNMRNVSQYKEADALLKPLCEAEEQLLGPYHSDSADCLVQLAMLRVLQGDHEGAAGTFQKVLAVQESSLPANSPILLATRIHQAEFFRHEGEYGKAREILELVLKQAAKEDPNVMEAKSGLAKVFEDQGEFGKAEAMTNEVLAFEKGTLGEDHPNTLTTMNNLAGIYRKQSRLSDAEGLYKKSLEKYRKIFGEDHLGTVSIMNNLGLVYETMGLYDEAELLLRAGLEISKKVLGDNHLSTLANMNNLAMLHESQGNFEQAEPHYLNAIEAASWQFGADHPDTMAFVNNLAYLYMMQSNYGKAKPLFEKVLASWGKTLGDKNSRTMKAINNLARSSAKLGNHKEAEALFDKALQLRRTVLGENHMDTLRTMLDLGSLYGEMKRYPEAEKLLRDTLQRTEKTLGDQHPYTFETLNSLGRTLRTQNKQQEAYQLLKSGFNRRSSFLSRMLWATGDNAREGYIRLHRPELDEYLAVLAKADATQAGREVLDVGLQRKGQLLKVTSEIQQIVQMGKNPQLKELGDKLTATRKKLAALTLSGPTEETKNNHMQAIHDLEKAVDTLQMELGQASRRFRQSAQAVTVEQLATAMPKDAVLVDFLAFNEGEQKKLLAGILRVEGGKPAFAVVTYPDLKKLQDEIVRYRTAIQEEGLEEEELHKIGQEVYDLIWKPLLPGLGNRKVIYVVPDDMLNILPFNALMDAKGEYLLKTTDLHILSTSRDLLPDKMEAAKGDFLIMAGPNYTSTKVVDATLMTQVAGKRSANQDTMRGFSGGGLRGLKFDPLPGAEKEGKLISETVKAKKETNTIFTEDGAQERVVQSLESPPKMLHVATHGFFLKADENLKKRLLSLQRGSDVHLPPPGDNPMLRAGLAFAGINGSAPYLGEIPTENDGVLTALEVLGLNLSGTKLAVLSACETGLGEIHEGEGVYGLRRAFQEAGVKTVISSLWEVSDAGTQALMTGLYSRLAEGKSAHDALLESQRSLLASKEWNYPYIWSAFMMVERM
ncbi:MAG: tetratricopeptide repeat protein [Magnetococcales bacterium]|nr:tetratricopeptide repeat protein [Magnetococcales bacterium]MBF0115398.1 tetratricopeptide repeat protein [Magnetococcales bacterium]